MENLFNSVAVCGIDCFNCEFFHSNIDGYFEGMPAEKKAVYESRGMTKEKLTCHGCRVSGCVALRGKCETLECARSKNIDFCYKCADFPCRFLQPMAEGAATYPHNMKVFNLLTIKREGLESWAAKAKDIREKYYKGKFRIGSGPQ